MPTFEHQFTAANGTVTTNSISLTVQDIENAGVLEVLQSARHLDEVVVEVELGQFGERSGCGDLFPPTTTAEVIVLLQFPLTVGAMGGIIEKRTDISYLVFPEVEPGQ